MTCALITKQSVDDKGPWSHWVGAAGLSRGKGHPCRGTPSITKTLTYLTSVCPSLLYASLAERLYGLIHCP